MKINNAAAAFLLSLYLVPGMLAQSVNYHYDVAIAGAGAGGVAAALQAARLGVSVVLIEETDWVGGQMSAAGVSTMDEGPVTLTNPSGIYQEIRLRLDRRYSLLGKSTNTCYGIQNSHCYEPKVVDEELRRLLTENRVTLFDMTRVTAVLRNPLGVEGIVIEGAVSARIMTTVLVDATEYGDVILLAGAESMVGNGSAGSCIQDITYTGILKKTVEPHRFPEPPPGYAEYKEEFRRISARGVSNYPALYPVSFQIHNQYRGTPDSSRTGSYTTFELDRITSTLINWANDWPGYSNPMPHPLKNFKLSGSFLTDRVDRERGICEAKLKTLNFLYYVQDPAGLNEPNWGPPLFSPSLYAAQHTCPGIPESLKPFELALSAIPYVRESVRIVPVARLTGADIARVPGPDGVPRGRPFANAIATADYMEDLHNCKDPADFEPDDRGAFRSAAGIFEIPIESVIPKSLDGFLAAEKNIGCARRACAAIRTQPGVMSVGQGVGALAAIAVKRNLQTRHVPAIEVQQALIKAGSRLSLYDHADVPPGSRYWPSVQLLATRQLMVGTSYSQFSPDSPLTRREAAAVITKTLGMPTPPVVSPDFTDLRADDWGLSAIEALSRAGLVVGCSTTPKRFCPDDSLSREQLAAILARGLRLPPSSVPLADVRNDNAFAPYISSMISTGIMEPCAQQSFCPTVKATRGQMAVAAARAVYFQSGLKVE